MKGISTCVYKKSMRGYQPELNLCKNKEGESIGEEKRILDRWAECFEGTFGEESGIERKRSL
jgi:hypothetical protein